MKYEYKRKRFIVFMKTDWNALKALLKNCYHPHVCETPAKHWKKFIKT